MMSITFNLIFKESPKLPIIKGGNIDPAYLFHYKDLKLSESDEDLTFMVIKMRGIL